MASSHEAVRVAIAGAASLRGKELKQCLEESNFPASEIRLLDEEFVAGTLTEAGGEPAVIDTVDEDSFAGARFAFFTGSAGFSARHGNVARRAGATVIDLSGGLVGESGARPWIPALDSVLPSPEGKVVLGEPRSLFVAPSAPADVAISLCAAFAPIGLNRLVLTFFQPVSERGREGVEELESQVAKLLSFEPIPQSVFDAQVGFNMLSTYGEESSEKLAGVREAIAGEVRNYLAGRVPMPAIALVQAPVFYSHAFTAYAEFHGSTPVEDVVARLKSVGLKVAAADDPAPTNVSVAGEARPVIGQPETAPGIETGIWLWGAADNLRVPATTAIQIAEKLLAS
jgi:aspartate-semialdehyde dehydrogenase